MCKTSGSSKAKSIRETMQQLMGSGGYRPKGWKTKKEWVKESGMGLRTFEEKLSNLLELGHAKKSRYLNEDGEQKWYYWINKLSDEDKD